MKRLFRKAAVFRSLLKEVREREGVPIATQLVDIGKALLSNRKMGLLDYFDFRLFSATEYGPNNPADAVVGWKAPRAFSEALNHGAWTILADDKISMYCMLRDVGVPVPETQALYHPRMRLLSNARSLGSTEEIVDFLRSEARYPLFCKPSLGCSGNGIQSFAGYDAEFDSVRTNADDMTPVAQVAERIVGLARNRNEWGYLFQTRLLPHDTLRSVTGDSISTFRVIILSDADGARIVRAIWRMIVGDDIIDSFNNGRGSTGLCGVDPMTGRVFRAVQGMGTGLRQLQVHPLTGQQLIGFEIPHWDDIRALCVKAARAIPMLQWQHWDVALTNDGPVVIELNCEGGVHVSQVGTGSGLMDEEFRTFFSKNRLKRS